MGLDRWPFAPDRITNDGEKFPADTDGTSLTGQGIIANAFLRGLETNISANLGIQTTIIEFSPQGSIVRTDSKILRQVLRPACDYFRLCTGCRPCYECDNVHASLFHLMRSENVAEVVPTRIGESSYIQEYLVRSDAVCQHVRSRGGSYLEYDCPLLGYRELAFPITVEATIVGVLFIGGIMFSGREQFVLRAQEYCIKSSALAFSEPRGPKGKLKCIPRRRMLREIRRRHAQWLKENPGVILDEKMYAHLVESALSEVRSLSRKLSDGLKSLRTAYANKQVDTMLSAMRVRTDSQCFGEPTAIGSFWQRLRPALDEFMHAFGLGSMIVLGPKRAVKPTSTVLHFVMALGRSTEITGPTSVQFDLARLEEGLLVGPTNSICEQRIVEGISPSRDWFDPEKHMLYLVPSHNFPPGSVAVLLEREDKRLGQECWCTLEAALDDVFGAISIMVTSVLAYAGYNLMEDTLRIFGHEAAQVTSGLDGINVQYLGEPDKLRHLSDWKAGDICKDIQGYLHQLDCLSSKAKFFIDVSPAKRVYFWAHKVLLYKWENTYRAEAKLKKLRILAHRSDVGDALRPQIYADRELLEQVLYNLVGNAKKYAHRGTNIYIDCRKTTPSPESPHLLIVTDYGQEMGDASLYGLYDRGAGHRADGLGIGLFLAEELAFAHGGKLGHECSLVSEYNVPLLRPYIQNQSAWESLVFVDKVRGEYDRLRHSGEYEEIVALRHDGQQSYKPTRGALTKEIRRPTYGVTFTVTIPTEET